MLASAPNNACDVTEVHEIAAHGDEDHDDDDDATVPLLLNLPTELIVEVVLWVVGPTRRGADVEGTDAEDPARDAAALAASCKQLHDLVVHSAVIWRALAFNSFVVEEASSDGPSSLLPMAWDNCTWKDFLILLRHISCQPTHELWAVGVVLQQHNTPNGGPHQNVIFPTRSKCVELTIPSLPFALLFFFPYHNHQSAQDEAFGVLVRACYDNNNKHLQQQQHTSDAQLCVRMEEQLINGARKKMKSRYITGGPKVEAGLFGSSEVLPCHHHHHHVMNETEDQSMLSLLYWYLCHPYDHCFEHLLLHPPWPPSHYSVAMGARRVSKLLVVHREEEEEEGEDNALGLNKMHSPTTTTTSTQLRVRLERRC